MAYQRSRCQVSVRFNALFNQRLGRSLNVILIGAASLVASRVSRRTPSPPSARRLLPPALFAGIDEVDRATASSVHALYCIRSGPDLAQGGHLRRCSETFGGHAGQLSKASSRPLLTDKRPRRRRPVAVQHFGGWVRLAVHTQRAIR